MSKGKDSTAMFQPEADAMEIDKEINTWNTWSTAVTGRGKAIPFGSPWRFEMNTLMQTGMERLKLQKGIE